MKRLFIIFLLTVSCEQVEIQKIDENCTVEEYYRYDGTELYKCYN